MINIKTYPILLLIIFSYVNAFPAKNKNSSVATVISIKGHARAKHKLSKNEIQLKNHSTIGIKTIIQTGQKSSLILLFNDNSKIILGPNSLFLIQKFILGKSGIFSLLNGELRYQISKNYSGVKYKDRSKLYIKTGTAAIGVSGTDLHVIYGSKNRSTITISYSGGNRMVKLMDNIDYQNISRVALENILEEKSEIIPEGHFSISSPKYHRTSLATRPSPAQLETLKQNSEMNLTSYKQTNKQKYKITGRGPRIPIEGSINDFINYDDAVKKQMKILSPGIFKKMQKKSESPTPSKGFYDPSTGKFAFTSGGLIDTKTALYIPPPFGSFFDNNTKTYILTSDLGTFDFNTGRYTAPIINGVQYQLNHMGNLIPLTSLENLVGVNRLKIIKKIIPVWNTGYRYFQYKKRNPSIKNILSKVKKEKKEKVKRPENFRPYENYSPPLKAVNEN